MIIILGSAKIASENQSFAETLFIPGPDLRCNIFPRDEDYPAHLTPCYHRAIILCFERLGRPILITY